MFKQSIAVTLAVLLTACSAARIAPDTGRTTYLSEVYQYGAGDRDLRLEVRGNPFAAADKPALDAVVERELSQKGMLQPPTRPRLHPDASAMPNYSLVVQFSRSGLLDAQDLCDGKADKPGAANAEVTVVMAFCVSGRAASQATGWLSPSGLDDPDLAQILRAMTLELFRPDDTLQGSGTTTP